MQDEKILKFHKRGLNNAEIGRIVGLTRERVRQILAKLLARKGRIINPKQ